MVNFIEIIARLLCQTLKVFHIYNFHVAIDNLPCKHPHFLVTTSKIAEVESKFYRQHPLGTFENLHKLD